MSWAEVNKIDESARLRAYNGLFIVESSLTWPVPQSGYYKVIAVGSGGETYGYVSSSGSSSSICTGGAGGVAIKTMRLSAGDGYIISLSAGDVYFDTIMTANGGSSGTTDAGGAGGTATGGDFNYTGNSGSVYSKSNNSIQGASVGCFIPSLMDKDEYFYSLLDDSSVAEIQPSTGNGILGHGASGSFTMGVRGTLQGAGAIPPQKGCVIIIPYIGI